MLGSRPTPRTRRDPSPPPPGRRASPSAAQSCRFVTLLLLVLLSAAGCAWQAPAPDRPVLSPGGAVVASPFSPTSARVFPLTHFEITPEGEPRILVFLELRDQWGDTVKGAGTLEIQLFRGGGAGPETRELVWEIDLTDLDRNAALYDPSTRTYRLALTDLPGWLARMARGGEGPDRVVLEAFFRTLAPDGEPAVLRDRYELARPAGD